MSSGQAIGSSSQAAKCTVTNKCSESRAIDATPRPRLPDRESPETMAITCTIKVIAKEALVTIEQRQITNADHRPTPATPSPYSLKDIYTSQ